MGLPCGDGSLRLDLSEIVRHLDYALPVLVFLPLDIIEQDPSRIVATWASTNSGCIWVSHGVNSVPVFFPLMGVRRISRAYEYSNLVHMIRDSNLPSLE